jgi:hypothetical protein
MKIDFLNALLYCIDLEMTSVFTSNENIQIRLTRNDDETQDDRIVILYRNYEDVYQIFFQDGNTQVKKTYTTFLTGDELDVYIESLFTLLARDTDPFKSINFMIPCFPVIQYNIEDLRKGKLRKALKKLMPILYTAIKL